MTLQDFEKLLDRNEDSHLEFKAKSSFSDNDLFDYCTALANEGGGLLVFGVDNNRNVVGSDLFRNTIQKYPNNILNALSIRVEVEEIQHPKGRVVIFKISSRPKGRPIQSRGKYTYPMRAGESLVEMDQETLRVIFLEIDDDFSSKIVPELKISDLDPVALNNLKKILSIKSDYSNKKDEAILTSLELLGGKGLNYAALILLGRKEKIDELLPCAEILFEWRQESTKIQHDFRKEWREPFLKIYDNVWESINNRNIRIPFQEGLIQKEVFAFNEQAVREALLNAFTHRDYTVSSESVLIKASPQSFIIKSPGGFLPGINPNNILHKQAWRNRRIAEVFQKLGLVERSGQGIDHIFESTIREGKGLPSFSESDSYNVVLEMPAAVKDKSFIIFLEKIINERQIPLSFDEIYELEILREKKIITPIKFQTKFLELGLIEKIGHTRGVKFMLSHRYYEYQEKPGLYTKIKGLSREQKKQLILNHISREGSGLIKDFVDVFPELKRSDIHNLLQELKIDGRIIFEGKKRTGFWKLTN